jgi:hypothetical protein
MYPTKVKSGLEDGWKIKFKSILTNTNLGDGIRAISKCSDFFYGVM